MASDIIIKMKTETQIAEENIEELKVVDGWIDIRKENYMSKELPRSYEIQNRINLLLGLSIVVYKDTGLPTMNLDRGAHLGLYKAILIKLISEHKASCQRFLEFLQDYLENYIDPDFDMEMQGKITDLKQAIKLYEDNGI